MVKARTRRARDARTLDELCELRRDNLSSKHGWILVNGDSVTITRQKAGEASEGSVTLPRAEFNRLIDWYNRPQPIQKRGV